MSNFQMAWRVTCLAVLLILLHAALDRRPDDARPAGRNGPRPSGGGAAGRDHHADQRSRPTQVQTTVSERERRLPVPAGAGRHLQGRHRARGFQDREFTDVIVAVGQEYSLTAKLEIGAITETVTVTAGSSLVSTTTPEVTATVLQKQVLDIPLANRDVTNLIKLQAGRAGVHQPREHRHQRRPSDLDAGDARRHQHPGQLHPHQLARLPAEPSDLRQRRGVLDHDVGVRRRRRRRRDLGPDGDARPAPTGSPAASSSSTATPSSRRTRSSTTPSERRRSRN